MLLQSTSVPYILITDDGKIATDSYLSDSNNRDMIIFLLHYRCTGKGLITGIRILLYLLLPTECGEIHSDCSDPSAVLKDLITNFVFCSLVLLLSRLDTAEPIPMKSLVQGDCFLRTNHITFMDNSTISTMKLGRNPFDMYPYIREFNIPSLHCRMVWCVVLSEDYLFNTLPYFSKSCTLQLTISIPKAIADSCSSIISELKRTGVTVDSYFSVFNKYYVTL